MRSSVPPLLALLPALAALACAPRAAARPGPAADGAFDVVIENGRVVDGTGAAWFRGDVGVRIARVAPPGALRTAAARRRIDARGLVVARGSSTSRAARTAASSAPATAGR